MQITCMPRVEGKAELLHVLAKLREPVLQIDSVVAQLECNHLLIEFHCDANVLHAIVLKLLGPSVSPIASELAFAKAKPDTVSTQAVRSIKHSLAEHAQADCTEPSVVPIAQVRPRNPRQNQRVTDEG